MTAVDGRQLLRHYVSATLAGLSTGKFDCIYPPANLATARETAVGSHDEFPFYLAQTHPHVEMAICHQGRVRLFMHGRWQPCPRNQLLVFLPGAMHSEKAMRKNEAYDLLWIHLNREVFSLHISAYQPGRGYFVHNPRQAFWPQSHGRLCNAVKAVAESPAKERTDGLARCRFQALVMDNLCHARAHLEQPQSGAEETYHEQMVHLVRRRIDEHFAEPLRVRDLAATSHYTPCYLNTIFKRHAGRSIHQYILDVRMNRAQGMLRNTDKSIKQIAFAVGFADPLYFSRIFTRRHGKSPRAWR